MSYLFAMKFFGDASDMTAFIPIVQPRFALHKMLTRMPFSVLLMRGATLTFVRDCSYFQSLAETLSFAALSKSFASGC
jgi:hypothetical protein